MSEANHEAAKGFVTVEGSIVRAHALQGRVNGRASRRGEGSRNPSSFSWRRNPSSCCCWICHEDEWKSEVPLLVELELEMEIVECLCCCPHEL